ncbi:MAG TPA: hypothetical protein VKD71_09615 [Gemmataceae bacterium]|nr:hypothetical protein [Gemmataceae bacterium]
MRPPRLPALFVLFLAMACNRPGETGSGSPLGAMPTFEYESTGGCSNFIVYTTNKGPTEVLVVSADVDRLGIKQGRTTLDIESAPKDLSVTIQLYPRPQKHLHLCTDFTDPESDKSVVWTAVGGKIIIEKFAPDPRPEGTMPTFRVKVTVEDAVFHDVLGRSAKCPHAIVLDSTVGWVPG